MFGKRINLFKLLGFQVRVDFSWIIIAVLIAFAAGGSIASVRSAETGSIPLGKLPDTVVPKSYMLDLTIVPERDRFTGHAVVTVDIRKASDHIWMHGRDLDVTDATLVTSSGKKLSVHYAQVDPSGVARLSPTEEIFDSSTRSCPFIFANRASCLT